MRILYVVGVGTLESGSTVISKFARTGLVFIRHRRSGPIKLDSFFRGFKCSATSGYAAMGSGFRS